MLSDLNAILNVKNWTAFKRIFRNSESEKRGRLAEDAFYVDSNKLRKQLKKSGNSIKDIFSVQIKNIFAHLHHAA